ncbi:hypothetical protein [Streptomyces sp. NPDC093568]|uniref:hypothetical protein n=1 Tax=Streptomyces sp. NPDC093568 TaxID=3366041 RepID=UPI00381BE889
MAVSLGMRISGLLVAGAVAVATVAFTDDGGGTADGRGGGGPIVTAGPTAGAGRLPTDPAGDSSEPPRQRPDGHVGAPASTGTPAQPRTGGTPSAPPSPSPSPSVSKKVLEIPAWLPPGPGSPDTDGIPDPASVYDLLGDPARCRGALNTIPRTPADTDWTLLRGLATACLAVQGEGGSWGQALRDHTASADGAGSCKGRAVRTVLGGLLDFHRRHPGATVRLKPSADGAPACDYRISGVDTGGDGEAKPGEVVGIEVADAFFDPAELETGTVVSIGGRQVPAVKSESADRLVLSAVVPPLEPGPADVTVRHAGIEVGMPTAFTVVAADVPAEVSCGPTPPEGGAGNCATSYGGTADPGEPVAAPPRGTWSRPPTRVLPFGPLPAHDPGPHAAAGLRIP